jgi:hypothetical protein
VSGFGSFIKGVVKKVTHNKVVKSVSKVVKKAVNVGKTIVNNPYVQYGSAALMAAVPGGQAVSAAIVTASLAAKAAKPAYNLVKTAIDTGKKAVKAAEPALPIGAGALQFVKPSTSAALGLGLKTSLMAQMGSAISNVAKTAQAQVNQGRAVAQAVQAKRASVSDPRVKAALQKAVKTKAVVTKAAPALAKQVVASTKVKAAIANIAAKAKAGSVEAKVAANVIAQSALALDKVKQLEANAGGGIAGLLITPQGRIVKSGKGRFSLRTATVKRPDILYRGAKLPTMQGAFAAVNGWDLIGAIGNNPEWGGADDPGDTYDGPLHRLDHPSGRWQIDDESAVNGWTP